MSLDTPEGPATDRADERMGKVLRAGLALTSGAATREAAMDQDQIYAELDRVRDDFRGLLDSATVGELRQPTNGT